MNTNSKGSVFRLLDIIKREFLWAAFSILLFMAALAFLVLSPGGTANALGSQNCGRITIPLNSTSGLNSSQTVLTVTGMALGGMIQTGHGGNCLVSLPADFNGTWNISGTGLMGDIQANLTGEGSFGQEGNTCMVVDYGGDNQYSISISVNVASLPNGNYSLNAVNTIDNSDPALPARKPTPNPMVCTDSTDFTINRASCVITSFTCDLNDRLAWQTAGCSSQNISPTLGSVGPTGSATVSAGAYNLSTNDGQTSAVVCPNLNNILPPQLNATWSDGSKVKNVTIKRGAQGQSFPFNFNNIGPSGSKVVVGGCSPIPSDPKIIASTPWNECFGITLTGTAGH